MSDPAKVLRDRLDELSRPRVAKCSSPSLEEVSQNRAAAAFRAGVEASGQSQRAIARRFKRDERTLRDWQDGSRVVPAWAFCALPREGQLAALTELANDVPAFDEPAEASEETERDVA